MAATLDGLVKETGAVFEAKFLPWAFSEEAAAEKHMAQLQHNMPVAPMHRSSESVAAIATALAKAQTELSNPEKAMVGTVYNNRSDSPQTFRSASLLSRGLGLVRRTLGGQQIQRICKADDRPPAHVRRMDSVGLAGLRPFRAVAIPAAWGQL
jgi:hypothetical protein